MRLKLPPIGGTSSASVINANEFDPKLPKQICVISMKSRELPWQAELANSDFSPFGWWSEAEPMRRLAYMFGKFQFRSVAKDHR